MDLFSLINPYLWGIHLRNFLYDKGIIKTKKLPIPVISIGNISCGGTGKTSLTRYLTENLSHNFSVGILLRGYKRHSKGFRLVLKDCQVLENWKTAGDEAYMLSIYFQNNPKVSVAVCEDRVLGAKNLINQIKLDLLFLDDAFQHRKIQRDLDLVLIKYSDLSDRPLPFGRLREPLSSLWRADAIVLSYQEICPFDFSFKGKPIFKMSRKNWTVKNSLTLEPLKDLSSFTFIAFSGLGDNLQFRAILQKLGIRLEKYISLPDHFDYEDFPLDRERPYLTTLKDVVKLGPRENLFYLDYTLDVPGLLEFIKEKLKI